MGMDAVQFINKQKTILRKLLALFSTLNFHRRSFSSDMTFLTNTKQRLKL